MIVTFCGHLTSFIWGTISNLRPNEIKKIMAVFTNVCNMLECLASLSGLVYRMWVRPEQFSKHFIFFLSEK